MAGGGVAGSHAETPVNTGCAAGEAVEGMGVGVCMFTIFSVICVPVGATGWGDDAGVETSVPVTVSTGSATDTAGVGTGADGVALAAG